MLDLELVRLWNFYTWSKSRLSEAILEGNNAVRILQQLGIAEDIKKKAGLKDTLPGCEKPPPGWFKFYTGSGNHELIYEVCLRNIFVRQ